MEIELRFVIRFAWLFVLCNSAEAKDEIQQSISVEETQSQSQGGQSQTRSDLQQELQDKLNTLQTQATDARNNDATPTMYRRYHRYRKVHHQGNIVLSNANRIIKVSRASFNPTQRITDHRSPITNHQSTNQSDKSSFHV